METSSASQKLKVMLITLFFSELLLLLFGGILSMALWVLAGPFIFLIGVIILIVDLFIINKKIYDNMIGRIFYLIVYVLLFVAIPIAVNLFYSQCVVGVAKCNIPTGLQEWLHSISPKY